MFGALQVGETFQVILDDGEPASVIPANQGTFISVIGISPMTDCESIWTFDGQNHTIPHVGTLEVNTYFEWFSMNSTSPQSHTLAFAGIVSGLFTLDYIMYTPSTSTLETQANAANVPRITTTPRLSNAGVAGVVIGTTAGLATTLLVLILLMRMKRRAKQARKESIEQVDPYPIPELPPRDMTQHKSSIPGVSIGPAREGSLEAYYVLPNSSDGMEHHSAFQWIMGAITQRNGRARLEPFRSISYRVRQSDLMVHHKPSVPDVHSVPTINRRIRVVEAQDVDENADDATSVSATLVVQEGDARSRAEHLRRLMAEIQRELAESGSVTSAND
ncbi:hypothetical protein DXG01_005464 [Tephrocybe rancida]|nr:hypothetical protein DXG01_005464 [Tephrocybe rancida]